MKTRVFSYLSFVFQKFSGIIKKNYVISGRSLKKAARFERKLEIEIWNNQFKLNSRWLRNILDGDSCGSTHV